ncbi:MAG: hypothetical protein HQL22_00855 [Candidatus Omnitrophica bacterium]|nr:hypothetical protein [Candidatus Omnitrophota bacterium]
MNFNSFMNSVRQWDNRSSQWFIRHFYVLFFEMILIGAFVVFFILTINTINITADIQRNSIGERLLVNQNYLGLLLVFLMLVNSFWMLFMFAGMLKIRNVLKNMDFNLSRRNNDRRPNVSE